MQLARVRARANVSEHVLWLAAVLSVALALRVVWAAFSQWEPIPGDDAYRYHLAATALVDGQGYVHINGEPTAFWPPGYPLLLAALYAVFGESIVAAQALNVVLGTATVGIVYLLGRKLLGQRPALVGAAIVAAFPSLILFTAVTLSEIAFTFLALLAVYLLVLEARNGGGKRRHLGLLLASGLILGYASLVRGQALLLPLVLIPFWWRSGIRPPDIGTRLAVLALGIALIVTPWTVRNIIQMDSPVLISTNAGVDFWIGHNDGADGGYGAGADELVFSHPELTTVEREVVINREGFEKGLKYALTHPLEEVELTAKKLFWLYYNDEEGLEWNEGHGGQPWLASATREALRSLSNVYYFAVMGFLILGVPLWFSLRDPGRVLLISLIAYWTLLHLAFFGNPRFHAPIMPVIALLAALPWVALWSGWRPRVRRT